MISRTREIPHLPNVVEKVMRRRPAVVGFLFFFATAFLMANVELRSQQAPARQQAPAQAPAQASAPAQAQSIAVNVKVVNVLATVRDKKGAIVRDLTQNEFELKEDDRPQTIKYFARETDLPLTLGMLVDTSMSQRRVIDQEKDASATFLDAVLRVDKDHAFVINFDRDVTLDQDLTSSREKLQAALGQLRIGTPQSSDDPDSGQSDGRPSGTWGRGQGGGGGSRGGGTALYDAIYLASNDVTAKQQGRKALIVLSDGVDRGSKKTRASAIEAAQRADTLVYSIYFSSEEEGGGGGPYGHHGGMGGGGMGGGMGRHGGGYPGSQQSRPDGKKILEQISKETGGRFFESNKKHPLDQTFNEIQEDLRNQYSLGYTPDPPDTTAGYHKIILIVKKKDLTVQARDGYYSLP